MTAPYHFCQRSPITYPVHIIKIEDHIHHVGLIDEAWMI